MDKERDAERKNKRIIREMPRELFLWLKSLNWNWNKEDFKKIIIGILLIIIAIIIVYCLIPKYEYVFVEEKTYGFNNLTYKQHALYRYNKITGELQHFNVEGGVWLHFTRRFETELNNVDRALKRMEMFDIK